MDLEFEKFYVIDGSPNIVLPCPRQFSRVEREKTSSKPHEILSPKQGFSDITFRCYRSASCKRSQPKNIVLEGNKVLKRGSVYQSSQECDQICSALFPRGLDPHLVRSDDLAASLGFGLLFFELLLAWVLLETAKIEADKTMLTEAPLLFSPGQLLSDLKTDGILVHFNMLQFLQPILNMFLHLIGNGGETLQGTYVKGIKEEVVLSPG
ncbi:hypothetical protein POM88_007403 [Heracleum sosnowskyi]|uniref:Uncharacterized protein n=1 Tax=Heracleum sosnowskyi TaxID=360622 RepID=A0AAD8J817_9APIA|nr:hypothetical protein POM88_007403 [Heracleum sosnowskyi]